MTIYRDLSLVVVGTIGGFVFHYVVGTADPVTAVTSSVIAGLLAASLTLLIFPGEVGSS